MLVEIGRTNVLLNLSFDWPWTAEVCHNNEINNLVIADEFESISNNHSLNNIFCRFSMSKMCMEFFVSTSRIFLLALATANDVCDVISRLVPLSAYLVCVSPCYQP